MKRSRKTSDQLKNSCQSCKAYLFDLDHTLLLTNTSFRFGFFLYKQNILPLFKMLYLLVYYGIHLLGGISITSLHKKTMQTFFRGRPMEDMKSLTEQFLNLQLKEMKNEPLLNLLEDAKTQGKFVAILSSSPDFLVEAVAKRLGVSDVLATRYGLSSEGVIQGIIQSIKGEDKADYVNRLPFERGEIAAFSDSIHDLPFLQAVGCPIAVNPDRKLKNTSLKNGWEIF